ncbi:BSD domain containing protein [Parasponia andersonii]|uniref:BSD domain containing protein n=1 Tax=Parasponia andersonii TaxID=3476 RepID=A0A2P5DUW2_PARAD|nr:BSD domain containing protein [Parasponia andersonii]
MSWLIKTLRSNDPQQSTSPPPCPVGVTEDLSVIGQTIGRQLRGVGAFLAPPPPTTSAGSDSSPGSDTESVALAGIRNDLAEIGGSFKSGLTLLSSNSNRAVSEISRFASSWLQFQDKAEEEDEEEEEEEEEEEDDDDDDGGDGGGGDGVPGITDEVLQFVTEISKRPEFWTDFPLQLGHEFSMSEAQSEHASSIEQFVPDFAALRLRICRSMSQEDFWMIYFILLVPRLSEHDFVHLSTSKIVEARDVLLQKLHSNRDAESENSEVLNASQEQSQVSETQGKDNPSLNAHEKFEVSDKANTQQPVDKEIVNSGDNAAATNLKFETEDDISFSDLEDDDSEVSHRLSDSRRAQDVSSSSPNESNDWVQLSKSPEARKKASQSREKDSEGEESNDWLTVDDFD